MTPRYFIAVPAYSGEVAAETVVSLIRAVDEARRLGDAEVRIRPRDSLLPRARNALVREFLDFGAERLIFWDADIACAPGDFPRLVLADAEFVCGAYRFRCDPENYPIRPLPGGWREEGGLIEVEAVPTGFVSITRTAIEAMIAARPDAWFEDRDLGRVPNLFEIETRDHEVWSEDFVFCRRFRETGGRIWIDPAISLTHIGGKAFPSRFNAWLGARLAAQTPPEALQSAKSRLDALFDAALHGRAAAAA